MRISDFHFDVPPGLIALESANPRSKAKLLVYDRLTKTHRHSQFCHLAEFLRAGDLLVFNNSYVIPARFFGSRETGGEIEGLLLQTKNEKATAWLKGKAHPGEWIRIDGFGPVKVLSRSGKKIELDCSRDGLAAALRTSGEVAIPPYIVAERKRRNVESDPKKDRAQYQSRFAKEGRNFSVAAPTASLHFDEELISNLKSRGVESVEVCLHIGEGTFAPVEAQFLCDHSMHTEDVEIGKSTWEKIVETKASGCRVIAVGTTVCRSLESAARRAERGENVNSFLTDLFIKPPFKFLLVDGLVTNFHWPDSTLVVLVATFLEAANAECPTDILHAWRALYREAIDHEYQLFSYGDGMLIL